MKSGQGNISMLFYGVLLSYPAPLVVFMLSALAMFFDFLSGSSMCFYALMLGAIAVYSKHSRR